MIRYKQGLAVHRWAILAACCAFNTGSFAQSPPAVGTWTGTWVRTEPVAGKGTLVVTTLPGGTGTLRLTGSLCLSKDTRTKVTVNGSSVRLDVQDEQVTASFVGTLSGDSMSGNMTVSCRGAVGKGSWQARKS